jgi:hypothetical protein
MTNQVATVILELPLPSSFTTAVHVVVCINANTSSLIESSVNVYLVSSSPSFWKAHLIIVLSNVTLLLSSRVVSTSIPTCCSPAVSFYDMIGLFYDTSDPFYDTTIRTIVIRAIHSTILRYELSSPLSLSSPSPTVVALLLYDHHRSMIYQSIIGNLHHKLGLALLAPCEWLKLFCTFGFY